MSIGIVVATLAFGSRISKGRQFVATLSKKRRHSERVNFGVRG